MMPSMPKHAAKWLLACTLFAGLAIAGVFAQPVCTDHVEIENPPPFDFPRRERFRLFWNTWLAKDVPFHMGHDVVVAADRPSQLTGKFDYGIVFHKDLEHEWVQAYIYGPTLGDWQMLGRYATNSDGKIYVDLPALAEGTYVVKMVVMGDLSSTNAYVRVVAPGTQAVVFDIDETLTIDDLETILDYTGIEYAEPRAGAGELVERYLALGYHPVFLTARPYWYAKGSRQWLRDYMHLPDYTLRTALSNEDSIFRTADYKTAVLQELQDAGITIFRAYGNADTDIEAYERAGIPKNQTYTIGDLAGDSGTTPIPGGGYFDHIDTVVADTPDSGCR